MKGSRLSNASMPTAELTLLPCRRLTGMAKAETLASSLWTYEVYGLQLSTIMLRNTQLKRSE